MATASRKPRKVSAQNPCPFLRALVAHGLLPDDRAAIGEVTQAVQAAARAGDGAPALPGAAIRAIACMANGLNPLDLARNGLAGLRLNQLRGGPLDKRGVGSGILDERARIRRAQLDRLGEFASDKLGADGRAESGLDLDDLKRMMDANFARAVGRRRRIDRQLMDGEWPILLRVMGKQGKAGRYLSLAEVRELFEHRRLPGRMAGKLPGAA